MEDRASAGPGRLGHRVGGVDRSARHAT